MGNRVGTLLTLNVYDQNGFGKAWYLLLHVSKVSSVKVDIPPWNARNLLLLLSGVNLELM